MSRYVPARLAASSFLAVVLLCVAALPAAAHASIPDGKTVPADGSAVIHVRLPHGCDGAATTAVSVQLPDGVVGARPELVAGWSATTTIVPAMYSLFGTDYTERVGTINWEGGPLPDGQFLDFGISATFQLEPGEYPLPVVQRCGTETVSWIEIPAAGQTHDDLEHPAPTFVVVDPVEDGGHDHGTAESPAPSDGPTDGTTDAQLTALQARVAALEAESTPAAADSTPTLPLAVVALILSVAGLGLAAVRRRS